MYEILAIMAVFVFLYSITSGGLERTVIIEVESIGNIVINTRRVSVPGNIMSSKSAYMHFFIEIM